MSQRNQITVKQCYKCGAPISFERNRRGKCYPVDVRYVDGEPQVVTSGGGIMPGKKHAEFIPHHVCRMNNAELLAQAEQQLVELRQQAAEDSDGWWDYTEDIQQLEQTIVELQQA